MVVLHVKGQAGTGIAPPVYQVMTDTKFGG